MGANNPRIIDAEFRVITHSRWTGWMTQLPSKRDRFAFICNLLALLALLGGLLMGFHHYAFFFAIVLCTVGCLISTEWRRYGMAGLVVAALLATVGCNRMTTAAPEPPHGIVAIEKAKMSEDKHAKIRDATRYRNPREGWEPKGIDILSGEVKAQNDTDMPYEDG